MSANQEPADETQPVAGSFHSIRPLSDKVFSTFQRFLEKETGIHLSAVKKSLLVGRLSRRLRDLHLTTFEDYYERVVADTQERQIFINAICTNETHFFREPHHFEFITEHLLPGWQARRKHDASQRRVRVWSAACSTGEEPYSLAMLLLDKLPAAEGWEIEILATDLSTKALDRAKAGLWPVGKASEIPTPLLKRFMLRGYDEMEGTMKIGPELQRAVNFQPFNLTADSYPTWLGSFDMIFCRNVLIYFGQATKNLVVERLLQHLEPNGHLFLGHAESLVNLPFAARAIAPAVYQPSAQPHKRGPR